MLALGSIWLLVIAGCSSTSTPDVRSGPDSRGLGGSITVSTASSLGSAFEELMVRFGAANPRAKVELNVASSTALSLQIEQGAPADVFASADTASADRLADAGLLRGRPQPFARNRMAIVTKPGNPRRIRTLADLRRVEVVALCVATAPCGSYAAEVLARAEVMLAESSVTREPDAAATVGAVAHGDADAAVVYASDAVSAKSQVANVSIPVADNVVATYPIALVAATKQGRLARAFITFVQSDFGQATLRRSGFLPVR